MGVLFSLQTQYLCFFSFASVQHRVFTFLGVCAFANFVHSYLLKTFLLLPLYVGSRFEQLKMEVRKGSMVNVNPTNTRPPNDTPEIRKYKKRFNSEILCAALWGENSFDIRV